MKKAFISLLFLFILINQSTNKLYAQDSSRLRISLLTCTPGDELYSLFGHSAIRLSKSWVWQVSHGMMWCRSMVGYLQVGMAHRWPASTSTALLISVGIVDRCAICSL